MKQFFNSNNTKALGIVNKYKNIIYSFLMADPSKTNFNHIKTIPTSERTDDNGYANFQFSFQEEVGYAQKLNVRVETATYDNKLYINANKVSHLAKCDMLVFPSVKPNSIYISLLDNFGGRGWLTDKTLFNRNSVKYNETSVKTYNVYNLYKLTDKVNSVFELSYNPDNNTVAVISDYKFITSNDSRLDTRVFKTFYDYNIDTSHIEFVQYDKRISSCVFWCFGKERYTDKVASTTKLATYLSQYTDKNSSAIYQQILKTYKKTAETGKAYSFKIKAKPSLIGNFTIDPELIDSDGNIIIYVSGEDNFNVAENKVENITDNIAEYDKVKKWIKRNPGKTNFPKKWSEENITLANKLILKLNTELAKERIAELEQEIADLQTLVTETEPPSIMQDYLRKLNSRQD